MANANRSNLTVLRARARNMPYIPAASLSNTLLDPAKLLLIIPTGKTWATGVQNALRPTLLSRGLTGDPQLVEIAPAQSPSGLVTEKGTANATPGWIDGFAAVPRFTNAPDSAVDPVVAAWLAQILTFGRIVWKGDEQIFRTMYLGDMQRVETAYSAGAGPAAPANLSQFGNAQAACGAPGQPVNRTPGYVWTGRSAADWYVENMGAGIVNATGVDIFVAIYVYGQFILNVDPLQAGTADLIRGGTLGATAGSCDDNAIAAMDGPAPAGRVSGQTRSRTMRCGS